MSIDYERMKREGPMLKGKLTRAVKSGSTIEVINACKIAVKAWNEIGAWPDYWSRWQRALDDALGYHLPLEDL